MTTFQRHLSGRRHTSITREIPIKIATFLAAAVAALALASPAGAATYDVAGRQKAIDPDAGT